jgi:hypothetical protein
MTAVLYVSSTAPPRLATSPCCARVDAPFAFPGGDRPEKAAFRRKLDSKLRPFGSFRGSKPSEDRDESRPGVAPASAPEGRRRTIPPLFEGFEDRLRDYRRWLKQSLQ